ncbi:MAG TPA: hypothetical protein VIN35_00645, partial [Hydrogenophaga sp.]
AEAGATAPVVSGVGAPADMSDLLVSGLAVASGHPAPPTHRVQRPCPIPSKLSANLPPACEPTGEWGGFDKTQYGRQPGGI